MIVFSQDVLDRYLTTPVNRIPWTKMTEDILKILETQARLAKENKEALLIILSGHADNGPDYAFIVGDYHKNEPANTFLKKADFEAAIPKGGDVCISTNACYYGAWAQNMDFTALTAAGLVKSELWTQSDTMKRYSIGSSSQELTLMNYTVRDSIYLSMITQCWGLRAGRIKGLN